ncbi:MAG: RelA/SpoT family protein, partial [Bacteroidota bacterium]
MAEVLEIQAQELEQINAAYEDMLAAIKADLDDNDRIEIQKSYQLALKAHSSQRRKSGEPYIFHPIAVAKICAEEIGLGATAIISALLHDVVEDTEVTLEQIRDLFGSKIARLVDGLTKLDNAYNAGSPQAENFKKVLSTLVEDVRVVLIKMADRLHNMRTLGAMPRHKQLKIAAETNFVYAPLAHRLGLYNLKMEYLDLCMKVTDPEQYHGIAKKLQETRRARQEYIKAFIDPLESRLDSLGYSYEIFGRPKSIYSIWKKIHNKNVAFEEIYDLFAVRIILDVPREGTKEKMLCWQAYSIVTDVYAPIPERLKDWVSTPKANGYESLHTTVIGPDGRYVEVQIRTVRMDEIAERGFAAHWKYKGINGQPDVYDRWLDSVREILDNPDVDAIDFLSNFKSDNLFSEEVYVYTPNGDMKILPKGATALDFAFSIHSDVGYHCIAIKVNKKLVPMGEKLKNGDQVQVVTSKNQKPNQDWLKMVITSKAKNKIRSSMKEAKRQQSELGKEALERKLNHFKVQFDDGIEVILDFFDYQNRVDLYFDIATGKLSIQDIFKKFEVVNHQLVEIKFEEEVKKEEPVFQKPKGNSKYIGKPRLIINGEPAEKYEYQLATCCNPVQGDQIFAYLTAGAGLKIHRTSCPNATHIMANYGYRVMKADWGATTEAMFVADLRITGIDDGPGVIERLSHQISTQLGLNIRSLNISGDEGYFEAIISILV